METTLKKALDRVRADEALKQKTADYIRNLDTSVIALSTGTRNKPLHVKKLVAAVCAAVVLCALPIGTYAVYKTPTSYVAVDINPSVELGINTFGKVVKVTPYNTDGETVLNGLSLINQNVESAVRQIVQSASQNGFMEEPGATLITVTTETNSDTAAQNLQAAAKTGAEDAVASGGSAATVETGHIDLTKRSNAIAQGIAPGRLNLIEKLQELDPTIKTEDYKDISVTEIQKKLTELQKEHKSQTNGKDAGKTAAKTPDPTPPAAASPKASSWAPASPSGYSDKGAGWNNKWSSKSGDGNKDSKNSKDDKNDKSNKNNKSDKNTKNGKADKNDKKNNDAGRSDNKNDKNSSVLPSSYGGFSWGGYGGSSNHGKGGSGYGGYGGYGGNNGNHGNNAGGSHGGTKGNR
ncbi:hypothetical protein SAMN02745823_00056 [Sporobacter termitidis DSM 10068]|uniref:Anti-sigma factor RsgI-like middle domain-containing protein n=1 Tax=Sporobacter termitidis DSM 10068 TaxID=1123282 RepID=A0A1M5TEC6_9FIRM|nr:hypothetical protein [Sporobacter termitidis]SHH49058.1 hypothetical protein SAMN02745823_00056 [Sporobacter termitidis DSM 10068]